MIDEKKDREAQRNMDSYNLSYLVNKRDYYNIMTALRGDDNSNAFWKKLFTARIRYLVGMRYDPDSITFANLRTSRDMEEDSIIYIWTTIPTLHYFNHVRMALSSLKNQSLIDDVEFNALSDICEVASSSGQKESIENVYFKHFDETGKLKEAKVDE